MTIPAKIGEFDPAVVVLTALVDGYAEVWVNGQLPRRPGYPPRNLAASAKRGHCGARAGKRGTRCDLAHTPAA